TKLAQQAASLPPCSLDPCTPTKTGTRTESKVTPDPQTMCPEPSKVTFSSELDILAELYCTCISGKRPHGGGNELQIGADGKFSDEKQRFASVLLLARLLAKFLGFISFLPYQTSEKPSKEIQETSVALRSKSVQVLDVCAVLRNSIRRRRTILTVPWVNSYLESVLFAYRRLQLNRNEEMCYLNKLLLVSVLGWLFQDCIPLVDQQLLYTCCPFLGEFRKLLAAFVSGSTARSGGIIRKITPTSAELKDTPTANRSQQKMQVNQLHGDSVLTTFEAASHVWVSDRNA
ncbi:hypothetical protein XENOCAPTIV_030751, partial [Xenoophorus captivus]